VNAQSEKAWDIINEAAAFVDAARRDLAKLSDDRDAWKAIQHATSVANLADVGSMLEEALRTLHYVRSKIGELPEGA
jgi:hypothetical protein